MSMIEHAVGVVSLDRFAEISHMDHDEIGSLLLDTMAENAKLRTLCRDMYLVVEILDMDGMRLQAHGKDADWRTLKERFEELMGIGVDE